MRIIGALSLSCLVLSACARRDAPTPLAPVVEPARTLDEVMRRTHFAFWPKDGAFESHHSTFVARVDSEGLHFSTGEAGITPLRLERSRLSRGAWRDESSPAAWQRLDDGTLWRAGRGYAERLENTDEGLEQSWRFEAAPPGDGALVVRVPVAGAARVESSERGLHFASRSGGAHYGHGTWIDADGLRTAVPVRFEGGAATLEVSAEVLARSRFPAVLDPLLSAEQDVDALALVPAFSNQEAVGAGSNGSVTLAVWSDRRRGQSDVYAARIDADGRVLEPFGLQLGSFAESLPEGTLSVASDGTDFLVVYGSASRGLLGIRVTGAGVALDAAPRVISPEYTTATAMTWDGAKYVVVAQEYALDPWNSPMVDNLVAMAVSPAGDLTSRVNLTNRSPQPDLPGLSWPMVASGGTVLLVCYRDGNTVLVRRLLSDLTLLDASPTGLFSGVSEARLAWDGQRFLVTAVSGGLVGARVTTAGVVIDRPPFRINSASIGTHGLAADDAGVAVTWTETRAGVVGLYAARITPLGSIVDVSLNPLAVSPATASRGRLVRAAPGFLALWQATVSSSPEIFAARVGANLTTVDSAPFRVSSSAARQDLVSVSWNGSHYLAAWVDYRFQQGSLFTTRLARDGTPVSGLATAGAVNVPGLSRPAVASDGVDWLVTWPQSVNGSDIAASRVSADGVWATDGGALVVSRFGDQVAPDVAWVGGRYVVVYQDGTGSAADLLATPVLPDGTALSDAGFVVSAVIGEQSSPRIAASDGGALVVWLDRRDGGSPNIFGTFLLADGRVADPLGFKIADQPNTKLTPAVAAGDEGYLVCWDDYRVPQIRPWAARVSPTLGLLDDAGIMLTLRASTQTSSCAPTFDGEHYFVAWTTFDSAVPITDSRYAQLRGTWVQRDGRILDGGLPDGGDWVFSSGPLRTAPRNTKTASPGHRQVLLAYTVDTFADAGGVLRVRTQTVTRGVAPVADGGEATTLEDQAVTVGVSATDDDGDEVTFKLARAPRNGLATVIDGGVHYVPARDFHGEERFTVVADDGALLSAPAEVVVVVTPVDDVPVASSLAVTTDEDEAVDVAVPGRDADDAGLSLVIIRGPTHGTLTGAPPTLRYAPTPDFSGADSITYALSDGVTTSPEAQLDVTVRPRPDAPVAVETTSAQVEDTTGVLELQATDVDGDALTFEVVELPQHGVLEGTAPQLRYAPASDYAGEDRLVFRVSDGSATATAAVRIVVAEVNDAPVARDATQTVTAGEPVSFTLEARDVDDAALTFTVSTGPGSGALTGEAPALTYTPEATFSGVDELAFEARDAAGATSTATVRFEVTAAPVTEPPAPSCGCGVGSGAAGLSWVLLGLLLLRRRSAL